MNSNSGSPGATAGIKEYARQRGVSPAAVRKGIREGRIAADAAGKVLVAESDARLAQGAVHGRSVSPTLADARRRKMAAAVRLLDDEVAALRASCLPADEVRFMWLNLCRESAASLATLLDLTPELAKIRPVMAAERLRERLHEILNDLATRQPDVPVHAEPTADGPDLASLSAVELATLRADLQAEALELKRRLRLGELLAESKVQEEIHNRILPARSRLLGTPTACGGWFELGEAEGRRRLRQDLADSLSELAGFGVTAAEFLPNVLSNSTELNNDR